MPEPVTHADIMDCVEKLEGSIQRVEVWVEDVKDQLAEGAKQFAIISAEMREIMDGVVDVKGHGRNEAARRSLENREPCGLVYQMDWGI